jgi:hypothetical protein
MTILVIVAFALIWLFVKILHNMGGQVFDKDPFVTAGELFAGLWSAIKAFMLAAAWGYLIFVVGYVLINH